MTDEEILKLIPQLTQSQLSLEDQLRLMRYVANKLGQYDAADYITTGVNFDRSSSIGGEDQ